MRNTTRVTDVNLTNGLPLSTEPVVWGTVSRASRNFHGAATPPVLHRIDCRHFRAADERSAEVENGGEPVSPRDLYNSTGATHIAFDRACRVCSRDME